MKANISEVIIIASVANTLQQETMVCRVEISLYITRITDVLQLGFRA